MFHIRASLLTKIIPNIKTRPNIKLIKIMAKNRTYITRQLDTTLPEVSNLLNTEVKWLCNLFLSKGYEIRVIGGAVRDMLMEKIPKDIDLSTTATPDQMIDLCKEKKIRYIETGLQHGTLTIHLNERDYEVTTLRIDVETFGRLAKVEFTQDWYLDAERRDLTVNAMSVDINGVLHDYFHGEEDLKNWKIRFVGNTEKRIKEDYLRILRYFRFYGKIAPDANQHEIQTLNTIGKLADGLKNISVERIWMEMKKILVGRHAPHLVKLVYEKAVAENIGLPAYTEEHFEEFDKVWSHAQDLNPHPVTLLVTLVDTVEDAEKLCMLWKLSNNEKNLACFLATYRYRNNEEISIKFYQDILVEKCNPKNIHIVQEQVLELLKYEGKVELIETIVKWDIPKFPLTGTDLKQKGIKPGPTFGKILNNLKESWMESYYQLSKEELIDRIGESVQKIKGS